MNGAGLVLAGSPGRTFPIQHDRGGTRPEFVDSVVPHAEPRAVEHAHRVEDLRIQRWAMVLAAIYVVGIVAAPFLPETVGKPLPS